MKLSGLVAKLVARLLEANRRKPPRPEPPYDRPFLMGGTIDDS